MLISPEYKALNAQLHKTADSFGSYGGSAKRVVWLTQYLGTQDVLDYGCGKGNLAKRLPFPIKEYDPGIPGKDGPAEPADIVICRDVLEHVEPECIDPVLADLARCVKKLGLFLTVSGPSFAVLADGRNAHVLQRSAEWWKEKVSGYFEIEHMEEWAQIVGGNGRLFLGSTEIFIAVKPKQKENGHGQ